MRIGFALMSILAVLVTLLSLRFLAVLDRVFISIDPGIHGVIIAHPVAALTHMLVAPVALLLGPLQFVRELRARHPLLHRAAGRIYVVACLVAGGAGFATALHASGGPVAGWGFGVLAVLWLTTTAGGWWAARCRRFGPHRILMRFSYAMTFGAVTLRLQIPLGFLLGWRSYSAMSVWLAYTAWIPNVIVVALYSFRSLRPSPARSTLDL